MSGLLAGLPWRKAAPYLAQLPVVAWLFAGPLFQGHLPFFRDVGVYYYPNYVFLERSLRDGVWPLWNPTSDAGAPFLISDPMDLALVGLLGAREALRFGPPLHLALAMIGFSRLAATLGLGPVAAWAAGLFYGCSGYVLSTANLFELFHATAWAPWVVGAAVRLWAVPSAKRVAALAVFSAVQVSTLGAETVLQTALAAGVLLSAPPTRRRVGASAAAATLALLLAAPALLGVRTLIDGTPRAEGLNPQSSFAFSTRPVVLFDALFPRFFGDVHTFSDRGYWGQPFFPDGYPYLLSLYCGLGIVVLAARAPASGETFRLVLLATFGVLLALGSHGPLAGLLAPLMRHFRAPAKFLFLANFAICLLAARGLERSLSAPRARVSRFGLACGALLVVLAALAASRGDELRRLLAGVVPEILDARAAVVVGGLWPAGFAVAGALLIGASLALASTRLAPWAGVLLGLDLVLVNGSVNLAVPPDFYDLGPEVVRLLEPVRASGPHRVFAYGAADIPDLRWSREVALRNQDVWLYYLNRQSLLPRTQVLDGLEAAFDEDRVGWAPVGATLPAAERVPARYREHHSELRLANVRFVVSFRPLPEDLVWSRGEATLPAIEEPLRLYELRDALPRAFKVDRYQVVPDAEAARRILREPGFDPQAVALVDSPPAPSLPAEPRPGAVDFERLGPHAVRLRVSGAPGLVVLLDGSHRYWSADAGGGKRPIVRTNGRYLGVVSHGGGEVLTLRYAPSWRTPAFVSLGIGVGVALLLASWGRAVT